jgi:hypothetical protein
MHMFLIARTKLKFVFIKKVCGAIEVLRIQKNVMVRRAIYHYDRCQVEVQ